MDKLGSIAHQHRLSLWTERIRECRSSGMTVTKWCELHNIGQKSYYYWLRKIRLEALDTYETLPALREGTAISLPSPTPTFAKIPLEPPSSKANDAAIVLHISGTELTIHNSATEAVITNTLAAIGNIASGRASC